ncbi:bifunctional (p)ppGpp synthetase/guanosine-3',5'-bis(diphosphate) 3'-pyrophosphohydrolase [candidate division WWE3 bacterium]|uniref:Bifunctional (P)ppGpp synthetase/guanosine-3',5'-bis(Diphosphate) 3'-pyrophosphohydrolase n=1 Tax=candidate division WWE3 bacterium TaxID=2053526 RepID=A0A955LKY5_UNCKA|nr:bifunctional (p)ppGpp synthetase/guanosine-3',5'-bis(diphosphate) 3'-pyrophosphohydrolase [candidate division WWE3 bacterium]
MDKDRFLQRVKQKFNVGDLANIEKALEIVAEIHADDVRLSGQPIVQHLLEVGNLLMDFPVDAETIIAALFHDSIELDRITPEQIEKEFGKQTKELVVGVNRIKQLPRKSGEVEYYANLRKLLLASARDVRVVLIRLVEKLHNLQTLNYLPEDRQKSILEKTFDVYSPLAEKLGFNYLKSRLDDEAFKHAQPLENLEIEEYFETTQAQRKESLGAIKESVASLLSQNNIDAQIKSRVKSNFGIYKKYLRKRQEGESITEFMQNLHDKYGVMVLVDTVEECYHVLGLLHQAWKYVQSEFDDYIATPKPNGYRSIQTAVFVLPGELVEIQIKTQQMHEFNEFGGASHLSYKQRQSGQDERVTDKQLKWLKQLLDWHDSATTTKEFADALKIDVFGDRIFVYTPKGDILDLPNGSTPIDFAYEIHTEVGNKTCGARVNGKMVPLDHKLESHDICEIITDPKRKGPSRDWLDIGFRRYTKSVIRHELQKHKADLFV